MILSKITKELKQINIFMINFEFAVQKSLIIYYNSENIIIFLDIKGMIYHRRTKHINIRYHYIKEREEDGEIKLLYIPIFKIIVNNLMKPLSAPLFMRNIGQLRFIKIIK